MRNVGRPRSAIKQHGLWSGTQCSWKLTSICFVSTSVNPDVLGTNHLGPFPVCVETMRIGALSPFHLTKRMHLSDSSIALTCIFRNVYFLSPGTMILAKVTVSNSKIPWSQLHFYLHIKIYGWMFRFSH